MVHVDGVFVAGRKERCDRLCEDLRKPVPINTLDELRWYACCHYSRGKVAGFLTIAHKSFTEKIVREFGLTAGRTAPLPTDDFLEGFDEDEPDGVRPFRELVGILMWLANQMRPDISNTVRAVATFAHAPKQ